MMIKQEQLNREELLNNFIFISSSCRLTKGASRSLIVDFANGKTHSISNEYCDLLNFMNRKKLSTVVQSIGDSSLDQFYTFIKFMLKQEFCLLTKNIEEFPEISEELYDDVIGLFDAIVEIDNGGKNNSDFYIKIIKKISESYNCEHLQLRVSNLNSKSFLRDILLSIISSGISYVELLIDQPNTHTIQELKNLILEIPQLSNIFIFDSSENKIIEYEIKKEGTHKLEMGTIICLEKQLEANSCGIISSGNFEISNIGIANLLKKFNGCLYKKLTIDTSGNIKNCPSMKKEFGNIFESDLVSVTESDDFRKLWNISNNQIDTCKVCEFRNICTGCRAFTTDPNNLYSKPAKCTYDPYNNQWN